ncbi:MAG: hypothetical protein L0K76_05350, partial [Lentilactobacillus parabuchneri]|nr:hypothetical protein [Lentilactobacillus parabuchneri]
SISLLLSTTSSWTSRTVISQHDLNDDTLNNNEFLQLIFHERNNFDSFLTLMQELAALKLCSYLTIYFSSFFLSNSFPTQ